MSTISTPAEDAGLPITKAIAQKSCVDHGYYRTPECNEKLYLHHRGFDKIAGLEEFTEVRVLWLESNAIRRIEGLDCLTKLRQLYLHCNMISTVEGLEALAELDSLNLSDNNISVLSGLEAQADSLQMLQLKNNRISGVEGLECLPGLRKLTTLDLCGNRVEDGDALLELLSRLPSLKSLQLTGNPCVRTIRNYRKTVLSRLPGLMHLDDKPVFPDERRLVAAWAQGGAEAERAEKLRMRDEEQQKIQARLDEFRELTRRAREAQGLPPDAAAQDEDDTDSDPSTGSSSDDDGDVWVAPGATPSNTSGHGRSTSVSSAASNPSTVATNNAAADDPDTARTAPVADPALGDAVAPSTPCADQATVTTATPAAAPGVEELD